MELNGLTGKMRFDNTTGNRNYFKLDVIKVFESKKHRLASWDPVDKLKLAKTASEMTEELFQSITNKTFIVVGKLVSTCGDNHKWDLLALKKKILKKFR